MHRVFSGEGRSELTADQVEAQSRLSDSVRGLIEATVLTDVDPAELTQIAETVAGLTGRLTAARRTTPPVVRVDGTGVVRQPARC